MDVHESDRSSENPNNNNNDATNRHGKSKSSSWGLSSAVHAVHGVGFVAKKVVNNRYTDSLWHSKKTTSSTASSVPSENVNSQSSQSSQSSSSNLPDEPQPPKFHAKDSCSISSNAVQLEDSKPKKDESHDDVVKPVDHNRRPTSSNTTGSRAVDTKPSGSSHARRVTQHLWPSVTTSNARKTSFPNHAGKPLPESTTDTTNPPSSSSLVDDKFIESQPSSPNKSRVFASTDKETTGVKPTRGSRWLKNPLTTKAVSPTPSREVSPTPSRGVSPTPSAGEDDPRTRDVSPTAVKSSYKTSGRKHFFNANILSVFTKMVDNRKEKNVTHIKEVAQHLELLLNIQVQWQFANASAEAALDLQRATAEKSLFDVWKTIFELRDSVASKKVDMQLLILQLKLYAVIYRQMAYMDEWASIQKEHGLALFATTNDLQARSLSVPITGGVTADIKGLKLILFSTIQVLQATVSCIQSTISKLDKTHFLASELANLVLHERALLDECELFLASAAPLHIEECSLMSYLLESNRTSMADNQSR